MDIIKILKKINRKPQIMHYKDIAYILSRIPSNKSLKILELGGGNGFLSINLLLRLKIDKLIIYEKRKEFYENLVNNLNKFFKELKNIEIVNEEFNLNTEINDLFDVIIVDIPYFSGLINKLEKILKDDGIIVFYVLNVVQLVNLLKEVKNLKIDEIVEIHLRKWIYKKIDDKLIIRPENFELSHTGILIFLKK